MDLFDNCRLNSSFDEMFNSNGAIKEHWLEIANALEKAGIKQLEQKQFEIDWRLEDNGVTYNIYNDPDGINRKWNLDPIPFVLKEEEWDKVTRGLKQRAKLLDLIFKDIYSEQKLLKDGIIPPEIIFSHKGFIPEIVGFKNKDYYSLKFYAADISRGPDGKFWLINDRTSAPSGLGYAIENRLTMNSIANELYPNINTKKLASFIDGFKKMLKSSTKKQQENPLIVLLTPGPHNETYFEHSYLSAFLDLALVQGEDLLARDNQIWLKNLNGLRKVDGILRRVDDRYCDPLELKNDSQLGVTGLLNVARNDNISIINPMGIGILENHGLNPFMKNICKYFLNEELILPQIATWWCGQESELEYVLKNITTLIIKKIDKTEKVETYIGKNLMNQDIEKLKEKIKLFPQAYIGQEHINFSTVPSFTGNEIEPRNAILRSFSYLGENGYEVMNGGLVRVAASKDSLMFSGQKMGYSKDLWILGTDDAKVINPLSQRVYIDSKLENISTKRAENLFWLGRYINRAIITSRMVRFSLKNMINIHKLEGLDNTNLISKILNNAITHLTMTYPGFLELKDNTTINEMVSIIKDKTRVGSLTFTLNMLSNSNINVKNLLTIDAWRIFDKMHKNWYSYTMQKNQPVREHINQINNLLIYLMAYKELIDESIFKEQGLILFDIGGKIEVSLLLVSKLRSLLTMKHEKMLQYEVIDSLLNSYESYNSYRAYYQSSLDLSNVIEFLIFNAKYPKSLIYIITELLGNLKELPKQKNSDYLSSCEEPIFKIYSKIKLSNPATLLKIDDKQFLYEELDSFLSEISVLLIKSSDELTNTYFSHNND
ncbi:MAG: circularly permuted type 2 ATP-grasp protein [Arcobacteraceae bacterium]|nr:circularly permuted type 2 ATP-grasp protein [Arcobacteraceae bacterium]